MPSGWIFRPIVEHNHKGINLTLEQTDLVLCKDCRYFKCGTMLFMLDAKTYNSPNQCALHSSFYPDDDWFCADAEEEEK